ncbi:hypothetical protein IAT38_005917 [Cryptococcus sp. DSM 104549]
MVLSRRKLAEEADETNRSLKTHLEAVELELKTTKSALTKARRKANRARNDLRLHREHQNRALKVSQVCRQITNQARLICKPIFLAHATRIHENILDLKKTVDALINRYARAFDQARECWNAYGSLMWNAYGSFMWEVLLDAIQPEEVTNIEIEKKEKTARRTVESGPNAMILRPGWDMIFRPGWDKILRPGWGVILRPGWDPGDVD